MIGRAVHRSDFAVNIAKMLDTHSFLNLFTTQECHLSRQDSHLAREWQLTFEPYCIKPYDLTSLNCSWSQFNFVKVLHKMSL